MRTWLVVVLVMVCVRVQAQTVMFSETKQVAAAIEKKIKGAKSSVWVAMYQFTNPKLAAALTNAAARGVDVRVVADKAEASSGSSCLPMLQEVLGTNRVFLMYGRAGKYSVMHNKFALVDGKTVLTGSYNWTKRADVANWENLLFVNSRKLVGVYSNEFVVLMTAAKKVKKDGPDEDVEPGVRESHDP